MQHISLKQGPHIHETLRLLSLYKCLKIEQLKALLYDISDANFRSLIRRLEKNGRLYINKENMLIQDSRDTVPQPGQIEAIWILIDFLPEITYHSAGSFPVTLHFFTETKTYEILFIPSGKEMMMNHAVHAATSASRLIIIQTLDQIPLISIPDISAFCLVSDTGQIEYYKKE